MPDRAQAREDQFLGCLLGLAIGDAMGRPVRGMTASAISEKFGAVSGYLPLAGSPGSQPDSGEITDKSEIALSLVESLTTNDGVPDPENMVVRLGFVAKSPSAAYLSEATAKGIELALEHGGNVPESHVPAAELSVAVRGVPIGLLHSLGAFDEASLKQDAGVVSRLSHGGEEQAALCATVATIVAKTGRTRQLPSPNVLDSSRSSEPWTELHRVLESISGASGFADGIAQAIALGGETDTCGALGGALLGVKLGASGIPQNLIDNLDARIYLTLAAPWFYRTAIRCAGTVIDLRAVD